MIPELFITISGYNTQMLEKDQKTGKLTFLSYVPIRKYFEDQYPDSDDCILLDKQILAIQIDIDDILKRELAGTKESSGEINFKLPCFPGTSGCNVFGYNNVVNIAVPLGIRTRSMAKSVLQQMMLKKKNRMIELDCRNKIETTRQDETAQVFTEGSITAEKRVIGDTKNKQYLLIGVAATVLITVAIIFLRNKK